MPQPKPKGRDRTPQAVRKDLPPPQRVRISEQMREVIRLMADEGIDIATAAQRVGIVKSSAIRAFNKPHVRSLYNQHVADIRANAAQAAYLRMNHLSKTATSEQVRADANKWVAGVDGIAALKRVEGRMHHQHTFGGFDYSEAGPIVDVSPDSPSVADDAQAVDDDE